MKAIVTVIGRDSMGIIAAVSTRLTAWNANIEDISQTIMQHNFVMVMLIDVSNANKDIAQMNQLLEQDLKSFNVSVRVQHEDIFNAMHRI